VSKFTDMIINYLAEEGYRPKIDEDGDIVFKVEGGTYFVSFDEKDPNFFSIVYPNFWEIESEEERERVLENSSEANAKCKAAKIYVVKDNTFATIEMFMESPEQFMGVVERCISALRYGVRTFVDMMRAEKEE